MPADELFGDENTVANRVKIYGFDNYQSLFVQMNYLYLFVILMAPLTLAWLILRAIP